MQLLAENNSFIVIPKGSMQLTVKFIIFTHMCVC
jgi:hypothetical protein